MANPKSNFQRGCEAAFFLVLVEAAIAGVTALLPGLKQFGIQPRSVFGLAGVAFGPLLHANLAHLLANLVPLFVLLLALFSNPRYHPLRTLAIIWVAAGLGTWLIGRAGTVHIGASSVIYGLAAYLVTAGVRMRSWRAAIVAILVFALYGGLVHGVLPQAGPISWEGHLCGAIAGIWAAVEIHD
jgi:membrane associated rhomboid family serine protease